LNSLSISREWPNCAVPASWMEPRCTGEDCAAAVKLSLHGDFDDDSSLVLTESSYFERLSFESPLDIKLRYDSIGKSLLFIGYSLSDINIRYLLYKLQRLWAESDYSGVRPVSYIFVGSSMAV